MNAMQQRLALPPELPPRSVREVQLLNLVERQADRIELLERLLSPPGPRAMARLRRSPWWVRALRRLGLMG